MLAFPHRICMPEIHTLSIQTMAQAAPAGRLAATPPPGRDGGMPPSARSKRVLASADNPFFRRSLCGSSEQVWKRHCKDRSFTGFKLATSHDSHDPDAANLKLSFLRRRSKIIEIVSAGDIVFALTLSGVCAAFRGSKRLAFLNTSPDEVIRSLFYNKVAHALITVSVYREDNFASLRCRSTPIEYISRGQPDGGFAIFADECLKWPGFVEFDEVNAKVLTYSAHDHAYRVWGMRNYECLYTLPDEDVTEIKISPGIMLLIHQRQGGFVPLQIVSIDDGSVLKSFSHMLNRVCARARRTEAPLLNAAAAAAAPECSASYGRCHCHHHRRHRPPHLIPTLFPCGRQAKKVEFIEQFNEKLLVKQEGENLHIVDVHTSAIVSVDKTEFVTPSAFVFLYEKNVRMPSPLELPVARLLEPSSSSLVPSPTSSLTFALLSSSSPSASAKSPFGIFLASKSPRLKITPCGTPRRGPAPSSSPQGRSTLFPTVGVHPTPPAAPPPPLPPRRGAPATAAM